MEFQIDFYTIVLVLYLQNNHITKGSIYVRELYTIWMAEKEMQTDWPKICIYFLTTFLIGFFTHFYFLSNKFINHDVLLNTFFYDCEDYSIFISSGRWAYMLFDGITSGFCMPQVKGLAALVYMAVSVVLITKILKYKILF